MPVVSVDGVTHPAADAGGAAAGGVNKTPADAAEFTASGVTVPTL